MSTTTTDPIADMLTRLRNAIAVRKTQVALPHSKIKEGIAGILKDSGYVNSIDVKDLGIGKIMTIQINGENSNARISHISRLSTPGRRHYISAREIPIVKHGRGIVIISTSKGIMTGDDAKKANIGGELICEVY